MSRFSRYCLTWAIQVILITGIVHAAPSITIRNNHDLRYDGPIRFVTGVPDGFYSGRGGAAQVVGGEAHVVAHLPGKSQAHLEREGEAHEGWPFLIGVLSVRSRPGEISLLSRGTETWRVDFGLVVIPGTDAGTNQAVEAFRPLEISLSGRDVLTGKAHSQGYDVEVALTPYAGGWIDVEATVTKTEDGPVSAYVALVRRVNTPNPERIRTSYANMIRGLDEPDRYHRNMTMTHGVDWCSWTSGNLWFAAINGFAAGLTHEEKPGKWVAVNSYYVRENVRREGDGIYLISRIAGPSPEQELSYRKSPTSYVPPRKGEPVRLRWRFAIAEHPRPGWQDSQMLVYSGFQRVTGSGDSATVDLGVPYVEFGTSYFPYSTLCENFDYYRVTGLDREGWWPFSPELWKHWREYIPQMQTDLRIIKAMGFDWVRLHHLELIAPMEGQDRLAFLDFYMDQCRGLGLKVLVDTAGSTDWMRTLARRYGDVMQRVELENEILIPGIKPGDPERWTASYKAIQEVNPDIQVFLTGNCNVGMFERLLRLGVPFDRAGYHFYQHGPDMDWATPSVALAMAGYARTIGREPTLGEFNWKILTRWTSEARAREFAKIYAGMLEPRAIPEFMQFHWQDTLSVNPRITRQGIRHYETIHLDRRPKPEAVEFMRLIRKYARPDSPVRVLPITIEQVNLVNGKAVAEFTIANKTERQVSVELWAQSFGDIRTRLLSPVGATLEPGGTVSGGIMVSLAPNALPGTYHFFVKAEYSSGTAYGWGIASNPGLPKFDDPIMPDLVEYPQGADVVKQFDYARPITVAFGKDAPVQEVEMAYQIFNTLQSATGRALYLCNVEELAKDRMAKDNLILVGTPQTNTLIGELSQGITAGKGTVLLHDAGNGRQWLIFTGDTKESVAAAATDFTLRYWENAKDSAIRIAGMEKGAALGNRARPGEVNMP